MPFQLQDELPGGSKTAEDEDVGLVTSALAGVYTGLWNIPKGFFSLGAELMDLGFGTESAASVEKFFDDLNPFDDEAEARLSGKLTQAIAQIAPLGIYGFAKGAQMGSKVARDLARKAVVARRTGKSFGMLNFGRKIAKTGMGVAGAGAAEAIVADEDIGTLADMLQGTSLEGAAVTMMDRETREGRSEAYRRLMNRVKFGTEGAMFNLGLIGAGKGIKKLRTPSVEPLSRYSDNPLVKELQKTVLYGAKPEGVGNKAIFEAGRLAQDEVAAVIRTTTEIGQDLTKAINKLMPAVEKNYLQQTGRAMDKEGAKKASDAFQKSILDDVKKLVTLKPTDNTLTDAAKENAKKVLGERSKLARLADRQLIKKLELDVDQLLKKEQTLKNEIATQPGGIASREQEASLKSIRTKIVNNTKKLNDSNKAVQSIKEFDRQGGGIFTESSYNFKGNTVYKKIEEAVKKAGGKMQEGQQLGKGDGIGDVIFNVRSGIDNMSARLLNRNMPEEIANILNDQIGTYMTTSYRLHLNMGLLAKHKPTGQDLIKAQKSRFEQLVKNPENINRTRESLDIQAKKDVARFVKNKGLEQIPSDKLKAKNGDLKQYVSPVTKAEIENIRLDSKILKPKELEEWQRIVAGEITDPRYNFYDTVLKQARLNANAKYLNNVYDMLSKGKNKQIFTQDDMIQRFGEKAVLNEKINPNLFRRVQEGVDEISGMSPFEGLYLRAPVYDAVFDVSNNLFKGDGLLGQFYQYGILAPKGVAQISKTILSLLTHARNFVSASAFAMANGIILPGKQYTTLFADAGLTKDSQRSLIGIAKDLTAKRVVGGIPANEVREISELLSKYGVTGTQVEANVMKQNVGNVINNTDQAAAETLGATLSPDKFGKVLRKSREIYGKLEDAYIAEDDFWKILTWGVERARHKGALESYGVNANNFNKVLAGDADALASITKDGKNYGEQVQKFLQKSLTRNYDASAKQFLGPYEEMFTEVAANITRNNVPNYAYIGRLGRTLRLSPFGNFIAFPIEVIRTGNNVLEQSIKEIKSGIPEVAAIGYKRLFGFGFTTTVIPTGVTAGLKAKNDVTNEEMDALRRFVPPWSKNSTLFPVGRDKDGYLKYVDFSYANAYDILLRPFNAVANELAKGDGTEDSLMKALGNGITEATIDLTKPFTSESIFTERFVDSTLRQGIGKSGRRIWSEADDTFVKIAKGVKHIAEAFEPGSLAQLQRISDSVTGKTDTYGRSFNFSDEIKSLTGFRVQKVDPERGMIYKSTNFGKNLKGAENLFTAPLLKGGRVSPEKILNTYKYSEQRRFEVLKEMYQDIEAARTLGMSNNQIKAKVKRRGISEKVFKDLMRGQYNPKKPSDFFTSRIAQINNNLNIETNEDVPNPYIEARPFLNEIRRQNIRVDLLTGELNIPDFDEPEETIDPLGTIQTPPVNTVQISPQVTGATNQNVGLSLPANFASLSTADKLKTLNDLGIRIG